MDRKLRAKGPAETIGGDVLDTGVVSPLQPVPFQLMGGNQ